MNMYIGENIKRLRREKGITQEKLADHLKISCQAVSKWERGETYPDIIMVIPLASYFGVSTDEILGLSTAENEKKIKDYLTEHGRMGALGKEAEQFNLMCAAHEEFPNDFRILENYAWGLYYDPNIEEPSHGHEIHKDELYSICERILDECTLDQPRYTAMSILAALYMADGKEDKAIETANRFPGSYYYTANEQIKQLYDTGSEKWFQWTRNNIFDTVWWLQGTIRNTALYGNCSPDEKIRILQKSIDLIQLIFDEKDYGFFNYDLAVLYKFVANQYIVKEDYEKVFENITIAMSYAKAYDDLPMKSTHTSYLLRGYVQDMMAISASNTWNLVAGILGDMKAEFYDGIRETDEFKAIVEKYTPFAGKKAHTL